MQKEKIEVELSVKAAQAYRSASPEKRRRAEAALAVSLMSRREAAEELERIMDEMSTYATEQGLTPEKLEELLREAEHEA